MERKNTKYDDITSGILREVENENHDVMERVRSIDSRAGMLLAFLIAAFPIYINIIDIRVLSALLKNASFQFLEVITILLFFASSIVFILTFLMLTLTLCAQRYTIVNVNDLGRINLVKLEDNNATVNDMNMFLRKNLIDCINYNVDIVEKKAKRFQTALWLCFSFAVLMVATTILKILI